jgi:hypothetical protein
MKTTNNPRPCKRLVFLTTSKGKATTEQSAMLKSIDGHSLAKPIEIANAGPLSHLAPLVDTLDKRRKRREKEKTRAAAPKVKRVKVHHA